MSKTILIPKPSFNINIILFDDFYSLDEEYFIKRIGKIQNIYNVKLLDNIERKEQRAVELKPLDIIKNYKNDYDKPENRGYTFFITNGLIQENYYGKRIDGWDNGKAFLMSFYGLDEFIHDWKLLNEYISRYLIIQIFKLVFKNQINSILLNKGQKRIKLQHVHDSGRCINNFARSKFITAFEVHNPYLCKICEKKIEERKNNLDVEGKTQITYEYNILKYVLYNLEHVSILHYLEEKLFNNPIVNFIFSGLIFGILINMLIVCLENLDFTMTNFFYLFLFLILLAFLIPIWYYLKFIIQRPFKFKTKKSKLKKKIIAEIQYGKYVDKNDPSLKKKEVRSKSAE